MKFSQAVVDRAILILEIYASNNASNSGGFGMMSVFAQWLGLAPNGDAWRLASESWVSIHTGDLVTDALEAAAMLRDGLLPVRDWLLPVRDWHAESVDGVSPGWRWE